MILFGETCCLRRAARDTPAAFSSADLNWHQRAQGINIIGVKGCQLRSEDLATVAQFA